MENFSVTKVSSKAYNKKRKKTVDGVTVKLKLAKVRIKHTVFNITLPLLFYGTVFSLCLAASKIRPLWQSTLIKPPFTLPQGIYTAISASITLIMMYFLYMSVIKKDRAQISGIIINGVICVLLFYMFFGLASPLGSLVIIIVLISQTMTLYSGFVKIKKIYAILLAFLLLWQIYNMLLIYTILMLN